jgi:hypothetical protein
MTLRSRDSSSKKNGFLFAFLSVNLFRLSTIRITPHAPH